VDKSELVSRQKWGAGIQKEQFESKREHGAQALQNGGGNNARMGERMDFEIKKDSKRQKRPYGKPVSGIKEKKVVNRGGCARVVEKNACKLGNSGT